MRNKREKSSRKNKKSSFVKISEEVSGSLFFFLSGI